MSYSDQAEGHLTKPKVIQELVDYSHLSFEYVEGVVSCVLSEENMNASKLDHADMSTLRQRLCFDFLTKNLLQSPLQHRGKVCAGNLANGIRCEIAHLNWKQRGQPIVILRAVGSCDASVAIEFSNASGVVWQVFEHRNMESPITGSRRTFNGFHALLLQMKKFLIHCTFASELSNRLIDSNIGIEWPENSCKQRSIFRKGVSVRLSANPQMGDHYQGDRSAGVCQVIIEDTCLEKRVAFMLFDFDEEKGWYRQLRYDSTNDSGHIHTEDEPATVQFFQEESHYLRTIANLFASILQ